MRVAKARILRPWKVTVNARDPHVPLASSAPSQMERLFPTLTNAQMARIAARGRRRTIARGEVLVEVGDKDVPFFVVVGGEIQALRPAGATEILIVAHGPGQFSGEANMITGRRAMARLRASEPGEVTQLERETSTSIATLRRRRCSTSSTSALAMCPS